MSEPGDSQEPAVEGRPVFNFDRVVRDLMAGYAEEFGGQGEAPRPVFLRHDWPADWTDGALARLQDPEPGQ